MTRLQEVYIQTNGIRLHGMVAGPQEGPLVILLHGFPEFWYGWRKQIAPLAEAGYRVMAVDQRGYNLSDKPAAPHAYRLEEAAADILGLIDAAGRERACIIGHDWGDAVGWWLALHHERRIEKLAVLNVGHPEVVRRHLLGSARQLARSWYVLFFQIPHLPEALMRLGDHRRMFAALRRTGRPEAFDAADEACYRRAWRQPGALSGMLNWYRAMLRAPPRPVRATVPVPTLMIWGARDRHLDVAMAQPSIALCRRGRLVVIEEATHWVHLEEAPRVSALLLDFLAERVD